MKTYLLSLILFLFIVHALEAQNYTQTIRGRITDKASQQGLPGANVLLLDSNPAIGTSTDADGYFKLTGIPVGRTGIIVSFLGYHNATVSNLNLTTGKEIVINVELEEMVTTYEEVVVTASKPKSRPNNDMAVVSARSFSVEETEKYAGSRGDVARMASNYAGVSFANDSRNDIVIRGNSPSGLLWKLDDVEIPNPNHFAENGTTGGPVGMLNNNVLKNSDFFTGAFPAEYGNAMSGVFDLKMRNGNTANYEFMVQSGFNGFEFGAEGPISKNNNSSFLINGRYSTLEVMDKLGVNFGTAGVPKYKDITFKLNYPTNKGVISWFGLAGSSEIAMLTSKASKEDMYQFEGQDLYNRSSMATSGLSYSHFISSKSTLKISFSGLYQNGGTDIDTLQEAFDSQTSKLYYHSPTEYIKHDISEYRATSSVVLSSKFNARLNQKIGSSIDFMGYGLNTQIFIDSLDRMGFVTNSEKKIQNGPVLSRSFYELSYKLSDQLVFNPGVHLVHFSLSKQTLVEPRAGINWSYSLNKSINFGYGLHSRTHALSSYYEGTLLPGTEHRLVYTNLKLKATRSHQYVLSHDWNFNKDFRLKTETYYQYLFDVPVEEKASSYSLLNSGAGWGPQAIDSLVNNGKGYNYGLELTFEKFLSNNYYFLITTSLFESKYRGSDDTLRNTTFNGNYVINALFGYEYPVSNKWTFGFDFKVAYAGGKRYTPIDYAKSLANKETEYIEYKTNELQYPDFLKIDVKFTARQNLRRSSMEWQIYIENVTNHKNILYESYSRKDNKVISTYQLGFFPMVLWRWNF